MANHSHKRDANARRKPRAAFIAGPIAVLATASAVGLGVIGTDVSTAESAMSASSQTSAVTGPSTAGQTAKALDLAGALAQRRSADLSRGSSSRAAKADAKPKLSRVEKMLRPAAKKKAIKRADKQRFTTEALNLWTEPGKQARKTGELDFAEKIVLTGRSLYGREEIVWGKKQTRWVTAGYTAVEKPEPVVEEPAAASVTGASCTNGTSVPSGVSPNIVKVHAAVCAAFPGISTYGTFRSDGEHSQGIAVDIMVSGAEGYRVADFVRANYATLGVSYIIYSQRIWSVERGSEGWRGMASRGSATANHYDHVHVTTY